MEGCIYLRVFLFLNFRLKVEFFLCFFLSCIYLRPICAACLHRCCQNCGGRGPVPQWRYKLTLQLWDHSGSAWALALGDVGKALFGLTATELYQLFCTRPLEYRGVVKESMFCCIR